MSAGTPSTADDRLSIDALRNPFGRFVVPAARHRRQQRSYAAQRCTRPFSRPDPAPNVVRAFAPPHSRTTPFLSAVIIHRTSAL